MQKQKKSMIMRACLTRRQFLLASGGVTATTILLSSLPGSSKAQDVPAKLARYPRKKIAKLSQLKTDVPITFNYPHDDLYSLSFAVKLGVEAGGGVGPKKDIVAFSTLCNHMGGDFSAIGETYLKEHKVMGPCPLHLTTFDLTRHGMVIAGHATESLPQVVLEVEGDDVYATGIIGLIYGKRDNLEAFVI